MYPHVIKAEQSHAVYEIKRVLNDINEQEQISPENQIPFYIHILMMLIIDDLVDNDGIETILRELETTYIRHDNLTEDFLTENGITDWYLVSTENRYMETLKKETERLKTVIKEKNSRLKQTFNPILERLEAIRTKTRDEWRAHARELQEKKLTFLQLLASKIAQAFTLS